MNWKVYLCTFISFLLLLVAALSLIYDISYFLFLTSLILEPIVAVIGMIIISKKGKNNLLDALLIISSLILTVLNIKWLIIMYGLRNGIQIYK